MRIRTGVWALVLPLCFGACDDTIFTFGGVAPYEPTYEGVEEMFSDKCSGCHPGSDPFVLADVEDDLRDETGIYVVANKPEDSLLWRKMSDTLRDDDSGGSMPPGAPLAEAQIAHVEAWILDGAPLGGE